MGLAPMGLWAGRGMDLPRSGHTAGDTAQAAVLPLSPEFARFAARLLMADGARHREGGIARQGCDGRGSAALLARLAARAALRHTLARTGEIPRTLVLLR